MKKIVSVILFVLTISFLFFSCNQKNIEKEIVGKWTVKSAEFMNLDALVEQMSEMGGLTDVNIDQLKQGLESDMKKDFEGASMEFMKDYSLKLSGDDNNATWEYDKKNKLFIIKEADMTPYKFIVQEFKGNKMKAEIKIKENGLDFNIKMDLEKE